MPLSRRGTHGSGLRTIRGETLGGKKGRYTLLNREKAECNCNMQTNTHINIYGIKHSW